ncbi:YqiA/YcfP family alpha/beta fold hydrolase [Candidatus Sororendozoicomonas aggregata]|uniref:YqiA/YcfP family alpha/beta fold hydrolase n=1 Tax=Candidatus Sororendozoicomonas aggregata TaxID=3073239 RepID=UPI002ED5A353
MNNTPLLVYLHGLNSAPQTQKAQFLQFYIDSQQIAVETWIPLLPTWPDEVKALLQENILNVADQRPIHIIGSSLGGFFGTWLQAQLQEAFPDRRHPLVAINPAVKPLDLFEQYVGPQENTYTGEKWELTEAHASQLNSMVVDHLKKPEDILLMVQTGDETLNYAQSLARYTGAHYIIDDGGSHAFDNFDRFLPDVFSFLG